MTEQKQKNSVGTIPVPINSNCVAAVLIPKKSDISVATNYVFLEKWQKEYHSAQPENILNNLYTVMVNQYTS